MRKLLLLLPLVVMSPAGAAEIKNVITDSVQLTVDGPATQSTRIGGSYSVSGTNITASSLGGFNGDATSGGAPDFSAGTYAQTTSGQAFTFSESITLADDLLTGLSVNTDGRFNQPLVYGDTTTYAGGTAGALAGTLSGTTTPTVTAGGPGSTVVGQRSVELSVFD